MAEAAQNEAFEIFLARLIERIKADLADEPDDAYALRKALLGLMLVQSGDRRAAKRYVTFLLEEFPPLADAFQDNLHDLVDEYQVFRGRDDGEGEHAELYFPPALTDDVMKADVSTDDLVLAGLRWPWERTAPRYVAFFDVMGFKAMLDRHAGEPEAIYELMDSLRKAAASAEELNYNTRTPIGPMNFPGCWVRFAQFSDSIVLITRDASQQSSALIALATQFMFIRALGIGVPIRGAIARGEFTADFDKQIFFGQPLVDAYLLEEKQAWYGACYHSSCDDAPEEEREYPPVPEGWLATSCMYQVPVKGDHGHEELNAINWAVAFHDDPTGLDAVLEHMRNDDHPKLRAYFEETRRFGHAMLRMMAEGPGSGAT